MTPLVALRFDIDTTVDILKGVPALLDLAETENIPMTFFVSPGRAVDYTAKISATRTASKAGSPKLSPFRKMGFRGTARTLIRNPTVGIGNETLLLKAIEQGHELGLHGGMNHGTWQRGEIADTELPPLLDPAIDWFQMHFGQPRGFTSPGFRAIPPAYPHLRARRIQYLGDSVDADPSAIPAIHESFNLPNLPALATPDGVPLIESAIARGHHATTIIEDITEILADRPWSILYGHPATEGIIAIDILRQIIRRAKARGARFTTVNDLAPSV